jgi:ABC-type Fe3+-hydroxamate transport system substrate-binding protein
MANSLPPHATDGKRNSSPGCRWHPQIERIVALAPDVVLMNEEENRREDADALRAAGVRVVSSLPRDVAGAIALVRELGVVLDATEPATALAAMPSRRAPKRSRRRRPGARR